MAIRYGYFNAVKDESTGVYDRVYNNEDLNNFLRGIINQNGVFSNVGDKFDITVGALDEYDDTKLGQIIIHSGKAVVNGHWVEIDGTESIAISSPSAAGSRYDMISLRWDDSDRTVTLAVTEGVPDIKKPVKPTPLGFSGSQVISYGNSNHVVLGEWDSESGVTEICLGYINVPLDATAITPNMIEYTVGSDRCPWISHLVMGPSSVDIDSYLAGFRVSFEEWFENLQEELTINTKIQNGKQVYIPSVPTQLTNLVINITGYIYSSGDLINVYLNGRRLVEGREWTLVDSGNNAKAISFTRRPTITSNEIVEIEVISGKAFDIPDGNDVLY